MTITDPDIAQLTEKKPITQEWNNSEKSKNQETERIDLEKNQMALEAAARHPC